MFPAWIKKQACIDEKFLNTSKILKELNLNTVCEGANCPNISECYRCNEVTFMILGNACTRSCRFCSVIKGTPKPPEDDEPERIVNAVKKLNLKHVVVTSPTRDDLADGGALQFVRIVEAVRALDPKIGIELLIPDFAGNTDMAHFVSISRPDVIAHNLETVPGLYPEVRPQASYSRSLEVITAISRKITKKSGLMLGLGETKDEVIRVMKDLRAVNCHIITLGQYLKPAKDCLEVQRYVTPDEFKEYEKIAEEMGFRHVVSGPFVRSSYKAQSYLQPIDYAYYKRH